MINGAANSGWDRLARELDVWAAAGEIATFWWRDDDAGEVTPALIRLVALSREADVPLATAVVPAWITDALPDLLDGVHVLQHGYRHISHAPDGEKKAELGAHRPLLEIETDLRAGSQELSAAFPHALPVLVPPWNRISEEIITALAHLGYRGLSTFASDAGVCAPHHGLQVRDTHVDIIAWRTGRGFVGEEAALASATHHLEARRVAGYAHTHPTGLLTHHLVHDEESWQFLAEFLRFVSAHTAATWLTPEEMFLR
ncbi:MAG: polysaccharide deacetylase family protein [Pseudomonadota bacterium]